MEELAGFGLDAFGRGDANLRAAQKFGVGDGIDALKFKDRGTVVRPDLLYLLGLSGTKKMNGFQSAQAFRMAGERVSSHFTAVAPRF